MKKNSLFVGLLALVLAFGMAVVGCDDETTTNNPEETLPPLPEPSGSNELSDKTYENSDVKVVFSSDATYRYYTNTGGGSSWEEKHNGNYSWDSTVTPNTVTLAPQKVRAGGALVDKAAWKADYRTHIPPGATDADAVTQSNGQYTTITDLVNGYADEAFALQQYTYVLTDGAISSFAEVGN